MEEVSGKVHKASTHICLVRVDVDALEVDVATLNVYASSLRAEHTPSVHRGHGRSVLEGSECEHLPNPAQRGVDGDVT